MGSRDIFSRRQFLQETSLLSMAAGCSLLGVSRSSGAAVADRSSSAGRVRAEPTPRPGRERDRI